jgi:DNA-binding NtrC family response regulator
VVDDDAAVVDYLSESLTARGFDVVGSTSATEALESVKRARFDLVISDVEMPELRGVDLLNAIVKAKPAQLVLLITAYGSVEMAVAAVRAGASDFLTKPFKIEALVEGIERALSERTRAHEVIRLRAERDADLPSCVVAESPAMRRVLDTALRAANTDAAVLISGETGSGKGVVARFIHDNSKRKHSPFVQLNCAAIPPSLAESELFGVRRGAFTGAEKDRDGVFVAAGRGTLFLDELGELPMDVQAKLLRALEAGTVRPLGGAQELPARARVITATNRRLEAMVEEGAFRSDLYYRVNVVRLDVPPLRERREDIPLLVDEFLAAASHRHERPLIGMSTNALHRLRQHSWPGNVRELSNAIERAVAMAEHDIVRLEDLGLEADDDNPAFESELARRLSLEDMERAYVRKVVDAEGGNKAAAARLLGITRRTLYRKLGE